MRKNTFCSLTSFTFFKFVFLMLFCLVTLCNCGSPGVSPKNPRVQNRIDPPVVPPPYADDFNYTETGKQIRRDYLNYTPDNLPPRPHNFTINDVWIEVYYGTYNGSIPVMMRFINGGSAGVVGQDVVADIPFHYGSGNRIIVWENGQFHGLQEAYDLGLLTQEDLRSIADLRNNPGYQN